jgi:hypothetical protein
MGACQYTNAWKNCATCAFWQGPRRLDEGRNSVTVDNNAQGQCDGFWKGSRKQCNNKCSEWRKWADIHDWSGVTREIYP